MSKSVKFNVSLVDKLEVVLLKHRLGYMGLGIFIELLAMLAESPNQRLLCDYDFLAYKFRIQQEVIKFIIEKCGLFTVVDGYFYLPQDVKVVDSTPKTKKTPVFYGVINKQIIESFFADEDCVINLIQNQIKPYKDYVWFAEQAKTSISNLKEEMLTYYTNKDNKGSKQQIKDITARFKKFLSHYKVKDFYCLNVIGSNNVSTQISTPEESRIVYQYSVWRESLNPPSTNELDNIRQFENMVNYSIAIGKDVIVIKDY